MSQCTARARISKLYVEQPNLSRGGACLPAVSDLSGWLPPFPHEKPSPPDVRRATPDELAVNFPDWRPGVACPATPSRRIAAPPRYSPPASSKQRRADAVWADSCSRSRSPRPVEARSSRCSPDRIHHGDGARKGKIPAWDRCAAINGDRVGECGQRPRRPPQGITTHWT
jgi:hypothetical protein